MKIRIISALLSVCLCLSAVGNTFAQGNIPPVVGSQDTTLLLLQAIKDETALLASKIDATDAKIAAIDIKFTAFENDPPWLKKIFTNPTVLGVITAVLATWRVTAK